MGNHKLENWEEKRLARGIKKPGTKKRKTPGKSNPTGSPGNGDLPGSEPIDLPQPKPTDR